MKTLSLGALAVATALAASACGAGASAQNSAATPALHAKLPKSVRDSGVLKIGGSSTVLPYLYKDGGGAAGIEKDLMDALGRALGVRIMVADIGFAGLVPALQSKKIDVAMSDFTDSAVREKSVTFVDYTTSFSTLLVHNGNPRHIRSADDLCGTTAAAIVGTASETLAVQQDAACRSAGKRGVGVLRMASAPDATTQIRTGRADSFLLDYVVGGTLEAKKQGQTVGRPYYPQFHGAAVRKDDAQMRDALMAGFTEIMADGAYGKVLDKWKVQKMAMPAPRVNAATS